MPALNQIENFHSDFEENYKIQLLGRGGFGTVYQCIHSPLKSSRVEEKLVSVKLVELKRGNAEKAAKEVDNLRNLNHPNVVKIFTTWIEDTPKGYAYYQQSPVQEAVVFIETEFCNLKSLRAWFDQSWRNKDHAKIILYQLAKGVKYLHEKNIIHGNLKPENVLLHYDKSINSVVAKISDYGLSRAINNTPVISQEVGLQKYKSPEMLKLNKFTTKADIYSLGVMFYEMLEINDDKNVGQSLPLDELTSSDTELELSQEPEDIIPTEEKCLIEHMMDSDVKTRFSAKEVLQNITELYPDISKLSINVSESLVYENMTKSSDYYEHEIRELPGTTNIQLKDFISFDLKSASKLFIGRDTELKSLGSYWQQCINGNSLSLVAITGQAGIGKTELAANYVDSLYKEIEGEGHFIWINAESPESIFESFKKLATQLGIPLKHRSGKEKNLQFLSIDVYSLLCNEKSLYVFDNIKNTDEIIALKTLAEYSEKFVSSKLKPFVLLSSRSKIASRSVGYFVNNLQLDVLSEESAIAILNATTKSLSEKEKINNFKFYPLALQQTIEFINAQFPDGEVPELLLAEVLLKEEYLNIRALLNSHLTRQTQPLKINWKRYGETIVKLWEDGMAFNILQEPVEKGHLGVLSFLLECLHEHPETLNEMINSADYSHWTPLFNAASLGHLEIVKLLVTKGKALVNCKALRHEGVTVLHKAAEAQRWGIIKWLVEFGKADIKIKNNKGQTVVNTVANSEHRDNWEMVEWLLEWLRKTDGDKIVAECVNMKDQLGESVFSTATRFRKWEAVQWLILYAGGNINNLDRDQIAEYKAFRSY